MNFKKFFELGVNGNNENGGKNKKNKEKIIEPDESIDITTHELANR